MFNFSYPIIGLFFLCLMGFISQTYAQSEINGVVQDKNSLIPINGVNVYLNEKKTGASSNKAGFFQIKNLTPGIYQLSISHVGYTDTIFQINTTESQHLTIFLSPDSIEMASVVVTATRTPTRMEDIPLRISKIEKETIEGYPATNTDNLLRMIPGINVNRSSGIFSRNSSVTIRGMPGAS